MCIARLFPFLLQSSVLLCCSSALAGANGSDSVVWVTPAAETVEVRSEAQKSRGVQEGRPEPRPELLQPALDDALHDYKQKRTDSVSGRFRVAASDILPGLLRAWLDAFSAINPAVEFVLSPPYAGSLGALALIEGDVDMVFVSRELKPTDIAEFKARYGYPPLSIPIVGGSYRHYGFLDALAVFVHKDNPIEEISLAELDAAFSSTRHRGAPAMETWGDLGLKGEWADKSIRRFGIEPWNGFEEFFRQRILNVQGKRGEWRSDLHFDNVVFPVARRVAADPFAIGYSGIAYLDAPVKVLPIRLAPKGPAVAPSYENVASALYPLSRLIYLNLNRPPGELLPAAVEELLRFILSRQGQQLVQRHGVFLPLRAHQVQESLQRLE